MRKSLSVAVLIGSLVLTTLLPVTTAHASNKDRVIHSFGRVPNGFPQSGLVADAVGNLYGTSFGNLKCPPSCGEVFQLKPLANGGFQYRVLHVFQSTNGDGTLPEGSLILDAQGNLYGTTNGGGTGITCSGGEGCGTVFKLSPTISGEWNETILYSFAGGPNDGEKPRGGLTLDSAGDIFGTTVNGGADGVGVVFKLTPSGSNWIETILHTFTFRNADGNYPWGVAFDISGNLWGVTSEGGSGVTNCPFVGCGTVYKLTPSGGFWNETVIYNFQGGSDGSTPLSRLVFDVAGNVYGTTELGGSSKSGTVFEVVPSGSGWSEVVLHVFTNSPDGASPFSGLAFDQAGNLYGTTASGGAPCSCGTVFEMLPSSGGGWTEHILYSFHPTTSDGREPIGNVTFGLQGQIYGTTDLGGPLGAGTVDEILP